MISAIWSSEPALSRSTGARAPRTGVADTSGVEVFAETCRVGMAVTALPGRTSSIARWSGRCRDLDHEQCKLRVRAATSGEPASLGPAVAGRIGLGSHGGPHQAKACPGGRTTPDGAAAHAAWPGSRSNNESILDSRFARRRDQSSNISHPASREHLLEFGCRHTSHTPSHVDAVWSRLRMRTGAAFGTADGAVGNALSRPGTGATTSVADVKARTG